MVRFSFEFSALVIYNQNKNRVVRQFQEWLLNLFNSFFSKDNVEKWTLKLKLIVRKMQSC